MNTKEELTQQPAQYYITADSTYLDDRTQVLNHCDTFGIFNRSGDILPWGMETQGLYHRDTRYINRLELKINGVHPTLLSSAAKEQNKVHSVDLTNPDMAVNADPPLLKGMIHVRRSQFVRDGSYHEEVALQNHDSQVHGMDLSLAFGGDFKDIFEVRGMLREQRGKLLGFDQPDEHTLLLQYRGLDKILRTAVIRFDQAFERISDESVRFRFFLEPRKPEMIHYTIVFEETEGPASDTYPELDRRDAPDLEHSNAFFARIETSNGLFNHWLNRSKGDLVSLLADTTFGKYPYAGVPWYNTAFGRDGIITALEVLWIAPRVAHDVLRFLAAKQASTLDEHIDAEPGKIMHEMRSGEMVQLNEVPFKQYYGTIDATPLFVILAGEYVRRTGDHATLKKIWPNVLRAMEWIDAYGDLDGDGFVEYQYKAKNGLTNQGWKDSYDSISHHDGRLADPPIALCEVQAYVYGALQHAADLADILQEPDRAEAWRAQAKTLKEKFNQHFWDEALGCYVIALDGDKHPCRVKSSNAGHALFTGIADEDKAEKLVHTLLRSDMFSGWGVRTLSTEAVRYNPMSYHNGSVWPHDVALIADGMAQYGYQRQALKLMSTLFDASLFINLQRLPELFCGMERRPGEGPTAYPVACSPQAWSVASVFLMLKSILQVNISAAKKEISFHRPILPSYLKSLTIRNLPIGDNYVDLELTRHGHDATINIDLISPLWDWSMIIIK